MASLCCAVIILLATSYVGGFFNEGDGCTLDSTGAAGVCTLISNCTEVLLEAYKGNYPQVCSFSGTLSIVCCDPLSFHRNTCPQLSPNLTTIRKTGNKARDYCISLADKAYPCIKAAEGWRRGDVCPAVPAKQQADKPVLIGEYPHLAALSYDDDKNSNGLGWHALGSLISDQWVLSDHYCASLAKFAKLGGLRWNSQKDPRLVFSIKNKVFHPDSEGGDGLYNRVGLLELDRKVTFSKFVFPVCLHAGSSLSEKQLSYISREGNVYYRWNMEPVSYKKCSKVISYTVRNATQMCATRIKGGVPTSIPGSPLQVNNDEAVACTQLLVAIHSLDEPSRQVLLVTRVYGVLPWIESIVWP